MPCLTAPKGMPEPSVSLHTLLSPSKGVLTDVDETMKGAMDVGDGHERQRDEQGKGKDLQALELDTPLAKQAGGHDRQRTTHEKHAP